MTAQISDFDLRSHFVLCPENNLMIVFVDILIPAVKCQKNNFECIRTCTHQSDQSDVSLTV